MKRGKILVNQDDRGRLVCLNEDYGRMQLQLKPGVVPEENELDLMGSFLVQCQLQHCNGLVLERMEMTERNVPVLLCYSEKARRMPALFFQHGFDSRKEIDLHFGMEFAKEGYFVILPDAWGHGERRSANFNAMYGDFQVEFLKIIKETAHDITGILDELAGDDRVDVSRTGITGVSMGGFICFLAATMDSRIQAAAPIIASPDWHTPVGPPEVRGQKSYDSDFTRYIDDWEPLSHPDRFLRKALLIQNGTADSNVSIEGSRRLFHQLRERYAGHPERLRMVEYPEIGHEVTDAMIKTTVQWFKRFIPSELGEINRLINL